MATMRKASKKKVVIKRRRDPFSIQREDEVAAVVRDHSSAAANAEKVLAFIAKSRRDKRQKAIEARKERFLRSLEESRRGTKPDPVSQTLDEFKGSVVFPRDRGEAEE